MNLPTAPRRGARTSAVGGIVLLLAATAGAARGQAAGDAPPGRVLEGVEPVSVEASGTTCLELGWPEEWGALSDSLDSVACRVVEAGPLIRTGDTRWRYALYRRRLVYVADGSTSREILDLLPDTVSEDELILFAGVAGEDGAVRPVWQDRTDAHLHLLRAPRALALEGGGALLVHRRCLNGTGGCQDHPYALSDDGRLSELEPAHLRALDAALPDGWGTWKGVWIEVDGPAATASVYRPGDANCCPSFHARAPLRVEAGRLVADSVAVTPVPAADLWRIVPGEGRFGPVTAATSAEDLRVAVGASQVVPADVYLAEGVCVPGARVFPGTPWEIEVAWSDSTALRPSFARVRVGGRPGSPLGRDTVFHTPEGVRLGTPLERLVELAGEPVRFGGFDWDYGGGALWTAEGGALRLRLDYDPERMAALAAGADSLRLGELTGDRSVTSEHPLVPGLGIRVVGIRMEWRTPETERFCG